MNIYEKNRIWSQVYFMCTILKSKFEVLFPHILAEIILELMSDQSKIRIYGQIICVHSSNCDWQKWGSLKISKAQ